MNHHNTPNQERPRNPNVAFTSDELKQRMAESAIERVARAQTTPIEVTDISEDTVPIPVAPRAYTDAELAALHGSEVRNRARTQSTSWIQGKK